MVNVGCNIQLWLAEIKVMPARIEEELAPCLSQSESQRLAATRNLRKRREYISSRWLLRYALHACAGMNFRSIKVEEREGFKPKVIGLPNQIQFSLSHSGDIVCVVVSDCCRIGVDIESNEKKRDIKAMSEEVMTEKELQSLKQNGEQKTDYFYRAWSAKEALFKALPFSSQQQVVFKQLCYETLKNDVRWNLLEARLDHMGLSLVSEQIVSTMECFLFPSESSSSEMYPQIRFSGEGAERIKINRLDSFKWDDTN